MPVEDGFPTDRPRTTRRELMRRAAVAAVGVGAFGVAGQLVTQRPAAAGDYTTQYGWRWCSQCQGLFFGLNGTNGVCTALPGGHNGSGSYDYYVLLNDGTMVAGPNSQAGWRWCYRCQGMFFGGNGTDGACPAGGGHGRTGGDYTIYTTVSFGQPGWAWCSRCQGMFFDGTMENWCPAIGHHSSAGSFPYRMLF